MAVAVLVVGALGLAASLAVIVYPARDAAGRADAVVVLSGDLGGRLPVALGVLASGAAHVLVVDGIADLPATRALCNGGPADFEVVCLHPEPDRTRTEARSAAELARSRGWGRVVVATDSVHVARARLLFDRCVGAEVAVLGAERGPGLGVRATMHEWLGILYSMTVARGC